MGKIAIVRGSDSGIGRAAAVLFAREGAAVVTWQSDDSDYVTGQGFVIDGGLEMKWGQGA